MTSRSLSLVKAATVSLCLVAVSLSATDRAAAQELCGEPLLPYCVNELDQLDSTLQIDRCQEDVRAGLEELKDYLECTKQKVEGLRKQLNDALAEMKKRRAKFEDNSD